MKVYPVGKAIDAIDELCKEGELIKRLEMAWGQLGAANSDFYLEDSYELRQRFDAASQAFESGSVGERSVAVARLIVGILQEGERSKIN